MAKSKQTAPVRPAKKAAVKKDITAVHHEPHHEPARKPAVKKPAPVDSRPLLQDHINGIRENLEQTGKDNEVHFRAARDIIVEGVRNGTVDAGGAGAGQVFDIVTKAYGITDKKKS